MRKIIMLTTINQNQLKNFTDILSDLVKEDAVLEAKMGSGKSIYLISEEFFNFLMEIPGSDQKICQLITKEAYDD